MTLQNIEVPESMNVDLQDMLSTFRTDLFGSDGWIISATKAVEAQFFKYTGKEFSINTSVFFLLLFSFPACSVFFSSILSYSFSQHLKESVSDKKENV